MSAKTHRAFSRNYIKAPILFSECKTADYRKAKMLNSSLGGMCFEADIKLHPGCDLFIKLVDVSPDPYWFDVCDGYIAEVRWCRAKAAKDVKLYGVGVRFIKDTCRQCGVSLRREDISDGLCAPCKSNLGSLCDGNLKSCILNYLDGNVL